MLFLILCQDLMVVVLTLLRSLGDGYCVLGSNN
jgi:hypothetical protein